MAKRVVLDQECCIGCEACANLCPDVFQMNDDDIAEVIRPEGGDEGCIDEAIETCPGSCIAWEG